MPKKSNNLAKNNVLELNRKVKRLAEFNRRIISDAPISIIIIDKSGTIIFTNSYFKTLPEDLENAVGKNIFDAPFFIRENLCKKYKDLLCFGTAFSKDDCLTKNLDGEKKYVSIKAVPLIGGSGSIKGALSIVLDATEAVSMRNKLRELNIGLENKIKERTKQLRKANLSLKHFFKSRIKFISDASHELRTPLTIIKTSLYLAKREIQGPKKEFTDFFDVIDREIDNICGILADLSLYTKIEEKQARIVLSKVNLESIMDKAVEDLNIMARNKKIRIEWKKRKKPLIIDGDKKKLETLFLSLINNAIKYSREKGTIKVKIERDNDKKNSRIIVKDSGIGIRKKDIPYIFGRFYKAPSLRTQKQKGIGLGLAICKWIVEQHKGTISVESELNKGSLFIVSLPMKIGKIKNKKLIF